MEPDDVPGRWVLEHRQRPWLLNAERAGGNRGIGGRMGRSSLASSWRATFAQLCQVQKVPALQWAEFVVRQVCKDRRMPDIGGCYPAVKAALDGIVDAGVLPDDQGEPYVKSILLLPPVVVGYDALIIEVTGPACSGAERAARAAAVEAKLVARLRRGA